MVAAVLPREFHECIFFVLIYISIFKIHYSYLLSSMRVITKFCESYNYISTCNRYHKEKEDDSEREI